MRSLLLVVGLAALAATMPALAQGQGRGHGRGHDAHSAASGGDAHPREARGKGRVADYADHRGHGDRAVRPEVRARHVDRRVERMEQRRDREATRVRDRGHARVDGRIGPASRPRDRARDWRGWLDRRVDRVQFEGNGNGRGIGPAGCPPGLARQNAFCMPPGQLRKAALIGQRLPLAALGYNVPLRYRYRFADDDRYLYRFDDGMVFRLDRATGLIGAVTPLAAWGLVPGEPLPLGYDVYNLPLAWRGSYPDGDEHLYRYDDGAIYRVDRDAMLVDGIVALLTGGSGGLGALGIGDPLPLGYDAYNVPLDWRDDYADSDDAWYRYADGSVYRIDPETRLIEAVISLLT